MAFEAFEALRDSPLYESFSVNSSDHIQLQLPGEVKVDMHCVKCGRDATFSNEPPSFTNLDASQSPIGDGLFRFRCTRENAHTVVFAVNIKWAADDTSTYTKFGQTPSFVELQEHRVKKYRPYLSSEKYSELLKGIGLASHDVGIGAFVYLRRVIEYLIEIAHQSASDGAGWDDEAYQKCRVLDKIEMIGQDFLPKFLVENKHLYSVLSVGVHELTEAQCNSNFDAVLNAVELILEQEKAMKDRLKKEQEARALLQKAHQGIKQKQQPK